MVRVIWGDSCFFASFYGDLIHKSCKHDNLCQDPKHGEQSGFLKGNILNKVLCKKLPQLLWKYLQYSLWKQVVTPCRWSLRGTQIWVKTKVLLFVNCYRSFLIFIYHVCPLSDLLTESYAQKDAQKNTRQTLHLSSGSS